MSASSFIQCFDSYWLGDKKGCERPVPVPLTVKGSPLLEQLEKDNQGLNWQSHIRLSPGERPPPAAT